MSNVYTLIQHTVLQEQSFSLALFYNTLLYIFS